jgi:hypothetical protein
MPLIDAVGAPDAVSHLVWGGRASMTLPGTFPRLRHEHLCPWRYASMATAPIKRRNWRMRPTYLSQ